MFSLERANHDRPVKWWTLVGVLLVPILVSLGFLGATWGAADRLHRVEAAVVNLDQMVEVNGQTIPLGRQLSAGLVERRDDNMKWTLADAKHAKQGLESGRYAAVVTIPKEFSKNATSFSGTPQAAQKATINVETSKVTGIADAAVARIIADTAASTVNRMLTESYLDNIYIGFNDMGKQFQTVADGARKLSDGTTQLSDGLVQSATGSRELATGTQSYADGVRKTADGTGELADGMDKLAAGGAPLASGAQELATGTGKLATGLETMATQTKDLPAQTRAMADGAAGVATGVEALGNGMQQIPVALRTQLRPGVAQYVAGVDQLVTGMEPALDALQQIEGRITPEQLQAASAELARAQSQAKAYAAQLEKATQAPCPKIEGVTPQQQAQVCAQWAQTQALLTTRSPQTGNRSPVEWAQGFANDPELTKAIDQTRTMLPQLPTLLKEAQKIRQLKPGGQALLGGIDQFASQVEAGNARVPELVGGAKQLADGSDKLADGMPALVGGIAQSATGARQLATGTQTYATGVKAYTDGVSQTAVGTRELATGMNQLADGGQKLADGTGELADGLGKAADGGKELAKGQKEMADGLAKGATQIPTYSEADRQALKKVVAEPVARGGAGDLIPEAASTSLVMVLALWLGALATYLVVQAVSSRALTSSRPTWWLAARSIAPGLAIAAVQALALTVIGQMVLGLSLFKTLSVLALLLLGGAVFVAVNHALVAWFGGAGRIISIVMVTLTAAAGIISAVPWFFDAITPILPLTPVLNGVRAIITDAPGVTGAVGMSLLWLVVALVASVGAVMRERTMSPEKFARMLPKRLVHA
ncbi:YhgE/Pip domain-containing protein [Mariniluteicoccus flavus]